MKKILTALKSYWIIILVTVLVLVAAAGYFAGYRIDQAGITRVGTLTLTHLPVNTVIYIDASRRERASSDTIQLAFTPGVHSVIVDAASNDPWNEIFTITTATDTLIQPLLIPTTIDKSVLTGASSTQAMALIHSVTLPTKAKPLMLAGGCARAYILGTRLIAEGTTTPACTTPAYLSCTDVSSENPTGACAPTIIFTANAPIRTVLPFPGRDDAVVVAAGTLVSVVELDPREPQSVAPIFKGAVTGAAVWSANAIVVTNGTEVIELPL